LIGRIAKLTDMQIVVVRVQLRSSGNGWPSEHCKLPRGLCASADIVDLLRLNVHPGYENDIGPREVFTTCRSHVLVGKTDRPTLRQVAGDQQQALRRHERLRTGHWECVAERPERGCIGREDAEDTTYLVDCRSRTHERLLPVDSSSTTRVCF